MNQGILCVHGTVSSIIIIIIVIIDFVNPLDRLLTQHWGDKQIRKQKRRRGKINVFVHLNTCNLHKKLMLYRMNVKFNWAGYNWLKFDQKKSIDYLPAYVALHYDNISIFYLVITEINNWLLFDPNCN